MAVIQKKTKITIDKIVAIKCDDCKEVYDMDHPEASEFIHHHATAGYGSVFGDGSKLSLDICQHCAKKRLGDIIRVTP